MNVDLSIGNSGYITFSDGKKLFVFSIIPEGTKYLIRIEDGWYNEYERNGKAICSGIIRSPNGVEENVVGRDIVSFESKEAP